MPFAFSDVEIMTLRLSTETAAAHLLPQKALPNHEIIAMEHSFHGRTFGALSVTGNAHYREAFEPMIGNVKFATYNDFEIETYPDGDVDRVLYVMLKSDAVSTKEGINTSSSKEDVIAAYGDPTEEVTGSLIYNTSSMKIKFLFNGDSMISIEYDSPKA